MASGSGRLRALSWLALAAAACGTSGGGAAGSDGGVSDAGTTCPHPDSRLVAGTWRTLTSRNFGDFTTRPLATVTSDDGATVSVVGIASAVVTLQALRPGCTTLHYTLSGSDNVHTHTVEVFAPSWFLVDMCSDVVAARRTRFGFSFFDAANLLVARRGQGSGLYPTAIVPADGAALAADASDDNEIALDVGSADFTLDTKLKADASTTALKLHVHPLATVDTFGPSSASIAGAKVTTLRVVLGSTSELAGAVGRSYTAMRTADGALALATCTGAAARVRATGWPICQLVDEVTREKVNELVTETGSFLVVGWVDSCRLTIDLVDAAFDAWPARSFPVEIRHPDPPSTGVGGGGGGGGSGLGD